MSKQGDKTSAVRRFERFPAKSKGVRCALGEILDLSGGGMRVLCQDKTPMKVNTAAKVMLKTLDGKEEVNVRCCWVKRRGWFGKHELGLKFIGMDPEQADRLEKIAKYGFLPESAGGGGKAESSWEDKAQTAQLDEAMRTHYEVLGLEPGASADELRMAYRKQVRECHPDVNPAPEAHQRFLRLQESYDLLQRHLWAQPTEPTQNAA
jgi:hypothetical protein